MNKLVTKFRLTTSPLNRCIVQQLTRSLSSNEAAIALRPFYFAVHPDRFALQPDLQNNNEKALQAFNGYLNNLFPQPGVMQSPIQIEFAVKDKENNLKSIRLILSGNDPVHILRTTLEKCNFSTSNLPPPRSPSSKFSSPNSTAASTSQTASMAWSAEGMEEVWQNLQENERIRRHQFNRSDFFRGIAKNRPLAQQKAEAHQHMEELIRDEIAEIQRRTGVTQILWSINWELSFMRRCLLNVQTMIGHAEYDCRETIIHALNGRILNFGRGSFVCCDGSLQFGADDATGAWQKVCIESTVRRFDVQNLELLVGRVKELLGGAQLIIRPLGNLLQTIQFMQIFIGRVCSQPKADKDGLKELVGGEQQVEIVNNYCELIMLVDGCLQIPCNVDMHSLRRFLLGIGQENREQKRREHFQQKSLLESAKSEARKHLGLATLSWDADLPFGTVANSLRKLRQIEANRLADFAHLDLHLSSSPKMMVLSNGKISVPIEWIEEL